MENIQEKHPRMLRLTDDTHMLFRGICKQEEMTTEGVMKKLISLYVIQKSKEEANGKDMSI